MHGPLFRPKRASPQSWYRPFLKFLSDSEIFAKEVESIVTISGPIKKNRWIWLHARAANFSFSKITGTLKLNISSETLQIPFVYFRPPKWANLFLICSKNIRIKNLFWSFSSALASSKPKEDIPPRAGLKMFLFLFWTSKMKVWNFGIGVLKQFGTTYGVPNYFVKNRPTLLSSEFQWALHYVTRLFIVLQGSPRY